MPTPKSNSTQLVVSVGVQCHVGNERTENQDRVTRAATPFGDLFVVADGVGGYQGGAEAAQATVDGFVSYLNAHGNLSLPDALQQAVRSISADLQQRSAANPGRHGMGSTVVLSVIQGTTATYAHAGDSRAYLLRERQLTQLTRDHSVMERLVSQGALTPEQARQHPDASVLTRAIGSSSDISLDVAELALRPRDGLLLCSDGLWAYAPHKEMETVAASENLSPSAVAAALLNLALRGGGGDNISIQFLRFRAVDQTRSATAKAASRITWPSVALASVLAVSSIGLYLKAHPQWDADVDNAVQVTHPVKPVSDREIEDSSDNQPESTLPAKPAATAAKTDRKKQPSAGTADKAGEQTKSAEKPTEETSTPVAPTPTGGTPAADRTSLSVIQNADGSKADWAYKLGTLSEVDVTSLAGNKECLAQARASATLFYSHEKKDVAIRVQKELPLSPSNVVEMSQEKLENCGGAPLIAMPAKPTIGKVIRGRAEQVGAQAEAAKEGIKNRVDSITKKKPQTTPNTDQPADEPENKDPQKPNHTNESE